MRLANYSLQSGGVFVYKDVEKLRSEQNGTDETDGMRLTRWAYRRYSWNPDFSDGRRLQPRPTAPATMATAAAAAEILQLDGCRKNVSAFWMWKSLDVGARESEENGTDETGGMKLCSKTITQTLTEIF